MLTQFFATRRELFVAAVLLPLVSTPAISGGVYTALHNFDCATEGCNATHPDLLAQGEDGVLYGAMPSGTSGSQYGTILSYAPGNGVNDLYHFGGLDGFGPNSGLTLGFDSNFYGTTTVGGAGAKGTVFRLSAGTMSVLYTFTNGADGAYPWAPPVQTPDGSLYGVTSNGGNPGTVYRIKLDGTFAVIATMPSKSQAPLVMATDGSFYGTSQYGGTSNAGTVFRLTPKGSLTIVHSFNSSTEGSTPIGPVVQAADGKFYGTTSSGGTSAQGIVYQLASDGTFAVLHNFQGTEGSNSTSGLVQASDKFLYGVMSAGGTKGYGTLYRIKPDGTKFQVMHQFVYKTGAYPGSTPTLHTNGTLYGFTLKGGINENSASGVLWSFTNGFAPFILPQRWAAKDGTPVGILGQGFSGTTGVTFGGIAAQQTTVVSDTYLIATVPTGARSGIITVYETSTNLSTLKKFKVLN